MSWLNNFEKEKEKIILDEVNSDELFSHVKFLSDIVRTSGTPGEEQAIEYVMNKLEKYGVPSDAKVGFVVPGGAIDIMLKDNKLSVYCPLAMVIEPQTTNTVLIITRIRMDFLWQYPPSFFFSFIT